MMTQFDRIVSLQRSLPQMAPPKLSYRNPQAFGVNDGGGFIQGATPEYDMPSQIGSIFREGHAVVAFGAIASDFIRREKTSLISDRQQFDPTEFVRFAKEQRNISEDQEAFLLRSRSRAELLERNMQLSREEARDEVMAGMSLVQGLGYGILAGVTDPTSYIPLFGQANKVKNVASLYRNTSNLIARGGVGVKAARLSLVKSMSGGFRRGFWHGAAESAAYESMFQSAIWMSRADKEPFEEGMLPSIAITSAFGGIIMGGVGAATTRSARKKVFSRAKARLDPSMGPLIRAAGANSFDALTPGNIGKGSGARVRAQYGRIVQESKIRAKEGLVKLLRNTGIAGDDAEASAYADAILSKQAAWLAPIRMDGSIRSTSYDLLPERLLAGEDLSPENLASAKGKLTKRINALAKDPETPEEVLKELRAQRAQMDRYGKLLSEAEEVVEATKDAAARNLNNPRPAAETAMPETLAKDGIGVETAARIAETSGDGNGRKFMQLLVDGHNATFGILDIVRYGLGRGLAPILDGRVIRLAFPTILGKNPDPFSARVSVGSLEKGLLGRYVPRSNNKEPDRIVIDMEQIKALFRDGSIQESVNPIFREGYDIFEKLDADIDVGSQAAINKQIGTWSPGKVFKTPEEYADYVLLHEIAHQSIRAEQNNLDGMIALSGEAAYDASSRNFAWKVIEAQTDALVMKWKRAADELAQEGGAHVSEGFADGPIPRASSIIETPGPKGSGTHAFVGNYMAQGWSKAKATKLVQWMRLTSPLMRAASSPSLAFRTLARHLTESPAYLKGAPVEGGAASMKVKYKYEQPVVKILRKQEELWQGVSKELDADAKVKWDDYDARIHRVIATGVDSVKDEYSAAVKEVAGQYRKFNQMLEAEGQGVGWVGRQIFPEGEEYYRRIFNMQKVNSPAFIKMLLKHVDEGEAGAIREALTGSYGVPADEFASEIGLRGALRKRSGILASLSYDELAPFLDTSAFRTQQNAAKAMGGEIELRTGVLNAARELNASRSKTNQINLGEIVKKTQIVNEETGEVSEVLIFSLDPIRAAIHQEFREIGSKNGLILDEENISLAFKRDWGKGSDLAAKYPEYAEELREFAESEIMAGFMDKSQIGNEQTFADKFLDQVVGTLQHTRDRPENPDSWWGARLPALIKNGSHAILGGWVGAANLADFHRSIADYGFKRAFGNEWGLMIKDLEGWSKRVEATEEMGFVLEDVHADIDRSLRNMSQHITPKTPIENAAETGARWMSKLNGMAYVTNAHQKAFGSTAQGFILDSVNKLLDGSISQADKLRLNRMNIDTEQAREIAAWMDVGGLKTTAKGTQYADMNVDGVGRELFKAGVQKAMYTTQTVPWRDEMYDLQVQSWGGVLMMYRNWVTAANNRVAATALSNADSAMMAGLAASIGLGATIVTVRWMLAGKEGEAPWNNPDQFLRDSMLSGGYLGLAGEAGNLVARATNDNIDPLILGQGNRARFHNQDTVMSALSGPVWHYPAFVKNTFDDTTLDRHDWNRIKGMVPFNNLFYVDSLWKQLYGN